MTANLGIGVMIGMLAGNDESAKAMQAAIGKRIAGLRLTDDALHLEMADGSRLKLSDEGQSCCESRYMRTDDDLASFIGAELRGAEVRDAPEVTGPDQYDTHEVQFLVVQTDKGDLTMSSHNEHNGYYGGFYIRAFVEN